MSSEDEVETITLSTKLGLVSGEIVQVTEDCKVAKFLGIPYAQQPIGELRFEPLQPIEGKLDSDEGPFLANKQGNSAIQETQSFFSTQNPVSEECIYLNIFVPLSDDNPNNSDVISSQKLPVLFHIHGGGFVMGSGGETYYDLCNFAATHRAVGVSINYRLNYLGFISLEGGEIEENLGLKDQQFALKWTHDNIGSFGGDPDNVTLFGCSAGAASVHYHMLSSESSKYFKRGIALSGVMTRAWSMCTRQKQKQKLDKLLAKLGCPKNMTPAETKKFLKSVSIEELYKFYPIGLTVDGNQFGPVDEYESDNLSRDFISKKPLILGVCAEEGNLFPDMLFPRRDTSAQTKSRQQIADMMTEKIFYEPLRKTLSELIEMPEVPTFVYMFDYNCQARSETYPEHILRSYYGKFHSLDIPFILGMMRADSKTLGTNEMDVEVQKTFNEVVDFFIRSSDESLDESFQLKKYVKENEVVNKINERGIEQESKECLYQNVSMLRAGGSLMMLKAFPNHF